MNEILKNTVEANYKSYEKFYYENNKKMKIEENIKCFTKLKILEDLYNKYYFGFGVSDNPDYF